MRIGYLLLTILLGGIVLPAAIAFISRTVTYHLVHILPFCTTIKIQEPAHPITIGGFTEGATFSSGGPSEICFMFLLALFSVICFVIGFNISFMPIGLGFVNGGSFVLGGAILFFIDWMADFLHSGNVFRGLGTWITITALIFIGNMFLYIRKNARFLKQ